MKIGDDVGGYLVYIHKRKDSGQIFYIGKGTKRRAYLMTGRSASWDRVAKVSGVDVEIDSRWISERDALSRENELIDANLATVVNKRRSRIE